MIGTGIMVVEAFDILQTRKGSTRGGAERWKERYIPVFGVSIGVEE